MNAAGFLTTAREGLTRVSLTGEGQWSQQTTLEGKDVRALAADPQDPRRVYAGTQGEGVWLSEDGGFAWRALGLEGRIVKALAVSLHDSSFLYAGTKPPYIFHSRDGGETWVELESFRRIRGRSMWFSPAEKPGTAYVQSIALSPADPAVILAGIEFGAVVRSADGGETWSNHRRGALRDCHTLIFHRTDGDWAYEAGGTGGGASVSRDGGQTWEKQKRGLEKNYGVACAADALNPAVWYVSVAPSPTKAYQPQAEAYLYRAGGSGWEPIGWEPHPMGAMPIAMVTDPAESGHLYAGLSDGHILFSSDFGDQWERLPFRLPGMGMPLIVFWEKD